MQSKHSRPMFKILWNIVISFLNLKFINIVNFFCEDRLNNKTIALNMLYVPYNTKQIKQAYISKENNERHNRVNLLMITDGTSNWHYHTVKSLSGLLRRITSNHNGDFCCLNCFHPYTTEKILERMKEYVMITSFAI